MKQIPSSRFRRSYIAESEPVEVLVHTHTLGYWVPAGCDVPEEMLTREPEPEPEVEAARFTIRPAHGPRPSMVGVATPVLDPVEMRKQARTRQEEIASRTFGRKPA